MNNEELIPIEKVLDDMYSDKSCVAGAARNYYKEHYASEEEIKSLEKEERLELLVGSILLCSPIILMVLLFIIKLL